MRRHLLLLIGIAFALRSLLPVGFMLSASPVAGAMPEIVICTGHGPQSWVLDENGVPRPAKSTADEKTTCPFAPAGVATAHVETQYLLSHTVRYASVTYAITAEIFRATPKPGAHSARGPPTFLI